MKLDKERLTVCILGEIFQLRKPSEIKIACENEDDEDEKGV